MGIPGIRGGSPQIPIENRLWKYIKKTRGCWLWLAAKNKDGYGTITFKRVKHSSHRVVFELTYGAIPKGMCVCHKCDFTLCVNPDHLYLGTIADNNRDRARKGRSWNVRDKRGRFLKK